MLKYLVLEPELDQSVSIARLLKKYIPGIKIYGGYTRKLRKAGFFINKSSWFDDYIKIDFNDKDIFDEFDQVIPTGADSTEKFAGLTKEIKLGNASFRVDNLIVSHKKKMLQVISKLGVPYPKTYGSFDEVDYFPVFYKNAEENTRGRTNGIIKKKVLLKKCDFKNYLFQEYIPGNSTFGVAFIAQNGKLLCSLAHEEILSFPSKGGSAAIIKAIENKKILNYTEKIIDHIKYNGWGLAEYKYCPKRKDFVFMEINAKFWASVEFSLYKNKEFASRLFNIELKEIPKRYFFYAHHIAGLFAYQYIRFLPQIIKAKPIVISIKKVIYFFLKKYIPFIKT